MVQETPFFDPARKSDIFMRLLPGAFVADGDGGFYRTRLHTFRQSAPGEPADQEAGDITVTKGGIPVVQISVPLKNMHTMSEVVDLSDAFEASKLFAALIKAESGEVLL